MVPPEIHGNVNKAKVTERYQLFALTLLVFFCWAVICVISRQPGQQALLIFLAMSLVMVAATLAASWRYSKAGLRISFLWIFVTAASLRLMSLYGVPLFEDDYHRYLWDGYQTVATGDPYSLAPAVFFDRDVPDIFEPVLSLINYPEIASVYGPVTQWVFALGYLLDAAAIWPLQLFAGIADLAVLVVLWRLGAGNALLLYAWSPLLLKEFSLTAHPDIYAILAVMLSIYLLRNVSSQPADRKSPVWLAGIVLGLGFGAKVFAILVLPYLLASRWSPRYWLSLIGWFVVTLLAITLWFGTPLIWVPEGLLAMADSWLFNAAIYVIALNFLEFQIIKLLLLGVFFLFGLVTVGRRLWRAWQRASSEQVLENNSAIQETWQDSPQGFRGDWLYLVFLLALPVINPWYVAWILPFATLYPRVWSWALGVCCLLSYWYGSNAGISGAGSLQLPTSVVAVEYLGVITIVIIALIVTRRHTHFANYREFAST